MAFASYIERNNDNSYWYGKIYNRERVAVEIYAHAFLYTLGRGLQLYGIIELNLIVREVDIYGANFLIEHGRDITVNKGDCRIGLYYQIWINS